PAMSFFKKNLPAALVVLVCSLPADPGSPNHLRQGLRWFAVALANAEGLRYERGQTTASGVTLFEGARLIVGDGTPPIENSAFIVQNNRFTRIGRKGDLPAPPGARRIALTGKTVMPALIDAHVHLGYRKG